MITDHGKNPSLIEHPECTGISKRDCLVERRGGQFLENIPPGNRFNKLSPGGGEEDHFSRPIALAIRVLVGFKREYRRAGISYPRFAA